MVKATKDSEAGVLPTEAMLSAMGKYNEELVKAGIMAASLGSLLASRRFGPLFVTQFLGAFNDNLLKNALGIYVIYKLAGSGPGAGVDVAGVHLGAATLVLVASALFITPFFLFSGVSGTIADRVDKSAIARWVKIVEIGIMGVSAASAS